MARFFAQVATIPFLLLGVAGLFLGDYGTVSGGTHHGNLGSVQLQLTWFRDAVDLAFAVVFVLVGFVLGRHAGKLTTIVAGALLLALAVAGFITGDKGFADLRFPAVINVFDLVAGLLAFLAGLGTIEDEGPASVLRS